VVPPLRDRSEEIPELVAHFLVHAKSRYPQSPVERFSPEALDALGRHCWPGNVRELAHTEERLVLLGRGPEIIAADIPSTSFDPVAPTRSEFSGEIMPIRELQRRHAAWSLSQVGGHRPCCRAFGHRRQDAMEVAASPPKAPRIWGRSRDSQVACPSPRARTSSANSRACA
jgi:DNA-binding NtrC family response regulator